MSSANNVWCSYLQIFSKRNNVKTINNYREQKTFFKNI